MIHPFLQHVLIRQKPDCTRHARFLPNPIPTSHQSTPKSPDPPVTEKAGFTIQNTPYSASIGFKSGEEKGHNSFGQNPAIFLLHHSWTRLAAWDVVPSSYKVIPPSSIALLTKAPNPPPTKTHVLTNPPILPNEEEEAIFPAESTPAQILTEAKLCPWKTSLPFNGMPCLFAA